MIASIFKLQRVQVGFKKVNAQILLKLKVEGLVTQQNLIL